MKEALAELDTIRQAIKKEEIIYSVYVRVDRVLIQAHKCDAAKRRLNKLGFRFKGGKNMPKTAEKGIVRIILT